MIHVESRANSDGKRNEKLRPPLFPFLSFYENSRKKVLESLFEVFFLRKRKIKRDEKLSSLLSFLFFLFFGIEISSRISQNVEVYLKIFEAGFLL